MEILIDRNTLIKGLGRVQSVVERRNTIPILGNVVLAADEGLTMMATDLDMETSETVPAKVAVKGSITAPAAVLYNIVRKLPDGAEVKLKVGGDDPRLAISAGRSHFKLPVLPSGDFPVFTAEGLTHHFEVKADELSALIDRCRFAISTEETRYYLNGLYVHGFAADGVSLLRAVSTDGHRLACADTIAPEGAADLPGMIIPRKTIAELRKLLEGGEDLVKVSCSSAKVTFDLGAVSLKSKLIDGRFPDYIRVIPVGNPHRAELDVELLAAAVDRVATISQEKSRSIKLAFSPGALHISARNMEAGGAEEDVELDYDGPATTIGLNARYILDVCSQIQGETVVFEFGDPTSPVRATDSGNPHVQFVVMPLRT